MRRSEYLALAKRLIAHLENGTTDSADTVKYVPVANYLNPARWQNEMDLYSNGCRCYSRSPASCASRAITSPSTLWECRS